MPAVVSLFQGDLVAGAREADDVEGRPLRGLALGLAIEAVDVFREAPVGDLAGQLLEGALLIAESEPKQKDLIIRLVLSLLEDGA